MANPCSCSDSNGKGGAKPKDPNIKQFQSLDPLIQCLIQRAVTARLQSYSPYSNFKVGASLLCEDGSMYTGCNCENVSFTVGTCAERCAYFKALSEGKRKFKAVVVIAQPETSITTPCGACRQFMSEFGNADVYMGKPDCKEILVLDLNRLLPFQFEASELSK